MGGYLGLRRRARHAGSETRRPPDGSGRNSTWQDSTHEPASEFRDSDAISWLKCIGSAGNLRQHMEDGPYLWQSAGQDLAIWDKFVHEKRKIALF